VLPALGARSLPGSPDAQPPGQGARGRLVRSAGARRACYEAPSLELARELRKDVVKRFRDRLPAAIACFEDDFEACIAHLRFPILIPRRPYARIQLPASRGIRFTALSALLQVFSPSEVVMIHLAVSRKPKLVRPLLAG